MKAGLFRIADLYSKKFFGLIAVGITRTKTCSKSDLFLAALARISSDRLLET